MISTHHLVLQFFGKVQLYVMTSAFNFPVKWPFRVIIVLSQEHVFS